ncbi:siderophore-interacting protein [Microbacterium sp. AISO3]|uniref:NADPH-dependent ferric siderophore reductase n=1 Tax=Microbacterium paludicola TaxID=300019 RepID=A0ABU1HWJ6_9MICO|nr:MULTISPECIES: siderophore-interacting protein [Microbacterium]APF33619.1 NADPH-dependent ferric siderophore reductase [Microbacterium paludicola]MDR6166016.1 NADPH-dependent ferric siderophore reductase [Microbacterium paludicola]OWP22189.1 siderophore-interacting protein [Microbacterium sp. AISO3]QCR40051.1 siderophore-interacting protein [Microbacterium sp. SGAir0570]GAD33330.1 siderophore-interacting protein [Microbacterium sp. TS-1]
MTRPALDFFRVSVAAITDLTPSFRRFTFRSDDLAEYGDPGFDQRVKILFPTETASIDTMPTGPDWYEGWRALAPDARPVMRTYTTRAVRPELREVDIDMVAHDVIGPASAWIADARVGDEVLILAPTTAHTGVSYGIDFVPPADTDAILLAGDETAAPAIAVILEQLPADARGTVVLELPTSGDLDYLPHHPGFERRIAARADEGQRHSHLISTVEQTAARLAPAGIGAEVEEIDIDADILWEVPRTAKGGAALKRAPLYAWLAGEASAIKTLRRHLVGTVGVDRRAVAFMGYWRLGRSEN